MNKNIIIESMLYDLDKVLSLLEHVSDAWYRLEPETENRLNEVKGYPCHQSFDDFRDDLNKWIENIRSEFNIK
jgi:hypothetical protein